MAVWRSTIERKTPRLRHCFDSFAKKPSTALASELYPQHRPHRRPADSQWPASQIRLEPDFDGDKPLERIAALRDLIG